MSRLFGAVEQLGFVVRDADATMKELAERLGIGPFYVIRKYQFQAFRYRGQPSEAPVVTLGFAQSGGLQFEIIQQHNDAPSAYLDFLRQGHEGMQHISSWYGDTQTYDNKRQAFIDAGHTLVHEGLAVGGVARFAYFSTGIPGAMMYEISEARLPSLQPMMDLLVSEAQAWNGADAVREFTAH